MKIYFKFLHWDNFFNRLKSKIISTHTNAHVHAHTHIWGVFQVNNRSGILLVRGTNPNHWIMHTTWSRLQYIVMRLF